MSTQFSDEEVAKRQGVLNKLADQVLNNPAGSEARIKAWDSLTFITEGNAAAIVNGRRMQRAIAKRERNNG